MANADKAKAWKTLHQLSKKERDLLDEVISSSATEIFPREVLVTKLESPDGESLLSKLQKIKEVNPNYIEKDESLVSRISRYIQNAIGFRKSSDALLSRTHHEIDSMRANLKVRNCSELLHKALNDPSGKVLYALYKKLGESGNELLFSKMEKPSGEEWSNSSPVKILEKAAERNYPRALYELASIKGLTTFEGKDLLKELTTTEVQAFINEAAELGDWEARNYIALQETDPGIQFEKMSVLAKEGYMSAVIHISILYQDASGENIEDDRRLRNEFESILKACKDVNVKSVLESFDFYVDSKRTNKLAEKGDKKAIEKTLERDKRVYLMFPQDGENKYHMDLQKTLDDHVEKQHITLAEKESLFNKYKLDN
jgi:hypothetical protein